MVTTLPRHSITETPDIAQAIDLAAATWPERRDNRAELARRLILIGADSVGRSEPGRAALVEQWGGFLAGVYPTDAEQALKDDWPQ